MMNRNVLDDLVSLVKVFDTNYVTDEDCEKLSGLDVNQEGGVSEAALRLLLPEFGGYTKAAQARLLSSLRRAVEDPLENFDLLFDRVEPAFDSPIADKRAFMRTLLHSLESQVKL